MKIEGNTIIFKSTPENFYKEKEGLKPCTIRRICLLSEMHDIEKFDALFQVDEVLIRIVNTNNLNEYFERNITDISQFEGLWIFCWKVE